MSQPVVWVDKDGKKQLIRGTPTPLLAWLVIRLGRSKWQRAMFLSHPANTEATIVALAKECLSRPDIVGMARHSATILASPPCHCGRPGLYVVNHDTYCERCRPRAVSRLRSNWATNIDPGMIAKGAAITERSQYRRRAERHHAACGRRGR